MPVKARPAPSLEIAGLCQAPGHRGLSPVLCYRAQGLIPALGTFLPRSLNVGRGVATITAVTQQHLPSSSPVHSTAVELPSYQPCLLPWPDKPDGWDFSLCW